MVIPVCTGKLLIELSKNKNPLYAVNTDSVIFPLDDTEGAPSNKRNIAKTVPYHGNEVPSVHISCI